MPDDRLTHDDRLMADNRLMPDSRLMPDNRLMAENPPIPGDPPWPENPPDDKVFYIRPNDIVHDTIEGETVVIDLQSGIYFRFDGAAAHAWNCLARRATKDDLIDHLAASYVAPREAIANQVHGFLIALYRDGIICREDRTGVASIGQSADPAPDAPRDVFPGLPLERFDQLQPLVGVEPAARQPFDGMTFHRFEDLHELLTIDPVHEVLDAGWPHRQAAD